MAPSKRQVHLASKKLLKARRERMAEEKKERDMRRKKVNHCQRCSERLILTLGSSRSIGTQIA